MSALRRPVSLVPLGTTGWSVWEQLQLRTAGFPAALVAGLADEHLAVPALDAETNGGAGPRVHGGAVDEYEAAYAEAVADLATFAQRTASDPRFLEAVAWQNPTLASSCVRKVAQGDAGRPAVRRRRELKVVSYLQRYALKNDTIGFFGPVGWARFEAEPAGPARAVSFRPGDSLLSRRTVYFERWALEAVAARLAADPEVRPWLRPRRSDAVRLDGSVLRRTAGPPLVLPPDQAALFELCDGTRPLRDLPELAPVLDDWLAADVLCLEPDLRTDGDPAPLLRVAALAIGDAEVRDRVLKDVDDLLAARDAVAAAAGDAQRVGPALAELESVFERIAGAPAERRAGQVYGGRRVVFEDTVRDMDVTFGRPLLDELTDPLGLLLESARWFVTEAADAYRARFDELYDSCRAGRGHDEVPLPAFLSAATPDLAFSYRELPDVVAGLIPEFQRRWAEILELPETGHRHVARSADLTAAVRRAFPRRPLPWSSAVHHCPDVMIAAESAAAVNRGDYVLVLGELHMTVNTLDSRVDLDQHPEPNRLTERDAADRRVTRILPIPATASASVNSRTYPPAMHAPGDVHWTLHSRNTGAPGNVLPGAALLVERRDGRLVVRESTDTAAAAYDLLDVLGEIVGAAVMNAFKPVPTHGHRPRVSIDRLVIAREAWSFRPDELDWAFRKEAADVYRGLQRWHHAAALPRRAFYRVAGEDKPLYIDFSSVALVKLLAAAVRASAEEDPDALVSFTEMLPDLGEHWVTDAEGAAYTSELRLVAVDGA